MIKELASQHALDFLKELYTLDVPISDSDLAKLVRAGLIEGKEEFNFGQDIDPGKIFSIESSREAIASANTNYVKYQAEVKRVVKLATGTAISRSEWAPESIIEHSKEFVAWIDSIRKGFSTRGSFKQYEIYKAQAMQWYNEAVDVNEIKDPVEQKEVMYKEFSRTDENSLYSLNKYYYYQDEFSPGGTAKFFATEHYEHQVVMAYLFDCGYSELVGKPRQFGGTTIFGLLAVNRILSRANYYIKFITEDKEKGMEIFEDKIKFAFYSLDDWFIPHTDGKPDVLNDRENFLRLGRKSAKGRIEGLNSRIRVSAPYKTAINGGTPSLVLIDETGSIDILSEMMNEGRPTMFRRDPITGQMKLTRQLLAWGTGTTSKGGAAFEKEYKKARAAWEAGDYFYGIIPLFFDWTTRCDLEEYKKQKSYYYGSRAKEESIDVETSRVQFHQHYPTTEEDMFATTQKLLIGRDQIEGAIDRIGRIADKDREQYGFMKPVFDTNHPLTHPYVAYKIIGAEFIVCDEDDPRITTIILIPPKPGWRHRYWGGTDPIASDDGFSNQSTTIWDDLIKAPVALTSFREPNNPNECFLQSTLLGILYDTEEHRGVPELIERNIGLAYKQFRENLGLASSLLFEAELSENFHSGSSTVVGIDNKSNRAKVIVNNITEIFSIYGDNVLIRNYWTQLKTFASKVTRSGNVTWGTIDPRYYKDDDLFSLVFAYIGATSSFTIPKDISLASTNIRVKYKTEYDKNMNLIRVPVTKIVDHGKSKSDDPLRELSVYSSF